MVSQLLRGESVGIAVGMQRLEGTTLPGLEWKWQKGFAKKLILKLYLGRRVNGMLLGGEGRRNFLSYALISHHGLSDPEKP